MGYIPLQEEHPRRYRGYYYDTEPVSASTATGLTVVAVLAIALIAWLAYDATHDQYLAKATEEFVETVTEVGSRISSTINSAILCRRRNSRPICIHIFPLKAGDLFNDKKILQRKSNGF